MRIRRHKAHPLLSQHPLPSHGLVTHRSSRLPERRLLSIELKLEFVPVVFDRPQIGFVHLVEYVLYDFNYHHQQDDRNGSCNHISNILQSFLRHHLILYSNSNYHN